MSNDGQEAAAAGGMPAVNALSPGDISACLRAGIADFVRAPLYGLFFGGVYFAGGLFILAALNVFDMPWMIIPVAIGFPLVGPFVAVGLYEVSRRLAAGDRLEWRGVLTAMARQRERQLAWMAFVVLFIFWIWIYQVRLLLAIFLGFKSFSSIGAFVHVVTATPEGLAFLTVGTAVGAVLALVLFSSTVIAIPLLLDREIDFVSAIITSFRAVIENPVTMVGWGLAVTALAILAMLPAFAGLLVVLPVLGHATWHLYRRAVAPAVPRG
ncbi:MAG: DUF2189 domain-containing protein [Rhizobiaceae bacterium]